MKKISVIVPIYKGNCYIPGLISMLEENWSCANKVEPVDIEVIFINDFPTEKMIVKEQWMTNVTCVQIENKENNGIHFARVCGVCHSKGDYVVFLDQDDVISPVYLREQMKKLKDYDMIICNGKNRSDLIYKSAKELERAVDGKKYKNGCNWIVSPGQVLLKKEAIPVEWLYHIMKKNGADDYFLWRLMFEKQCKVGIHSEVLFWHVISDSNTSGDLVGMNYSVLEVAEIMKKLGLLTTEEEKEIRKRREVKKIEEPTFEDYSKEQKYKRILDVWMNLRDRRISVEKFLKEKHWYEIVIYGGGIFGKHLHYELSEGNVHICCFMDQKGQAISENVRTVLPGEDIGRADVIIVTPVMEYQQIKKKLSQIYSCEIVSLETVLLNADCELVVE